MLFIKTQFGSLVNLENVTSIVIEPRLGVENVVAYFENDSNISLFVAKTKEECQEYMEVLFQWIPHIYNEDYGRFQFKDDND